MKSRLLIVIIISLVGIFGCNRRDNGKDEGGTSKKEDRGRNGNQDPRQRENCFEIVGFQVIYSEIKGAVERQNVSELEASQRRVVSSAILVTTLNQYVSGGVQLPIRKEEARAFLKLYSNIFSPEGLLRPFDEKMGRICK